MTILDQLTDYARVRVAKDQAAIPPEEMKRLALASDRPDGRRFYEAMASPGLSLICEVKKASPSKGIIDEGFNYMEIAGDYEAAGADGMSVLTEPKWFLGSDDIFTDIRKTVTTPMLRKDFVVDEYQLYQAKVMGADCILLICAVLDTDTIRRCLALCEELQLAALVETHNEEEIASAVAAGARMIGVNNRNLKDFSVDFENAKRLRAQIPESAIYVAESGVTGPEDAAVLSSMGADAILVGEALMRAPDRRAAIAQFRRAAQ